MNKDFVKNIPSQTGVYLMQNKNGETIYIGKAKNLRKRVLSYFYNNKKDPKTNILVKNISNIDYIVTKSETEALITECNLIKAKQPKYNILLKDNKTYPFIKITTEETYPRVFKTRILTKGKNLYFGPYPNGQVIQNHLNIIHKLFPLRTCTLTIPSKQAITACLDYHIHKCAGCCIDKITPAEYRKYIDEIILFLKGRFTKLIVRLEKEMKSAAREMLFEKAQVIKKQIEIINEIDQKQRVLPNKDINLDAFGMHQTSNYITVSIIFIREGKLIGKRSFVMEETDSIESFNKEGVLTNIIRNYYSNNYNEIPKEIVIPIDIETKELISFLKTLKNKKVNINIPKIGQKKDILDIASHNAKFSYIEKQKLSKKELVLSKLKDILKLPSEPRIIEGFDISNTDGNLSVASLVSFYNGYPRKKSYRLFKIKTVDGPNDVASIKEVIARRYTKVKNEELIKPDLILIDGGKGQVSSAKEVLKAINIDIPIIGLAKKNEEIFFPNTKNALVLPKDSKALHLLQQIRDEAHRFGNTFHKQLRSKKMFKSILDDINGVGKIKKQSLLNHFKHIEKIKTASIEELKLARKIDNSTAKNIYDFFKKEKIKPL